MKTEAGRRNRPTLALIGAGRAGSALAHALHEAGYSIAAVCSRNLSEAEALAGEVGAVACASAVKAAQAADVIFLTVPDLQIGRVAAVLANSGAMFGNKTFVHCRGSSDREILASLRITGAAVANIHPLQALSGKNAARLLRGSGFAVDADDGVQLLAQQIVRDLGGVPLPLTGVDRRIYHAAAVLAGNAPLALLNDAVELLTEAGVDRRDAEGALLALMQGALENVREHGIADALTGPVARGDAQTISAHLDALRGHPEVAEIYRSMIGELVELAGDKGREAIKAMVKSPHRAA